MTLSDTATAQLWESFRAGGGAGLVREAVELVDTPMNRPGFGGGSGARRVSLGRPRPWTPSIAQRRSGHRAAQLNNSSGVERAARSLIVTASTDPGPIAVAVWEVLCGSIPITTVICRSSWLPNNGFHGGQPEFRKRSRLYRATPQRAATGPTRCERATPKWARNVRAQPVTDLAPYVPVETGMLAPISTSQEPAPTGASSLLCRSGPGTRAASR